MIRLKRIKTQEDLKDVLCMIHEDVLTFKPINRSSDVASLINQAIEMIEHDHVIWDGEE